MKKVLFCVLILNLCLSANATTYVYRDKSTGEPLGTASISEKHINQWSKRYFLHEVGEDYRGLAGYEIKYDNGKLRKATEQEIDTYLSEQQAEQEAQQEAKEKEMLIKLLANEEVKQKVKDINEVTP